MDVGELERLADWYIDHYSNLVITHPLAKASPV